MITIRHKYLFALGLISLIFVLLIFSGSLLWKWGYIRLSIISFVIAVIAMFGQLLSIVLLSRTHIHRRNTNE